MKADKTRACARLSSSSPPSSFPGAPGFPLRSNIPHPSSFPASAFTLVELMISLAMMVVLMLAVNYIFSSVGKATGTAQTISGINRDVQASQTTMYNDFANIALDGPFIEIHSERQAAFKTKTDRLSNSLYVPGATAAATDNAIRDISIDGNSADDIVIPRPVLGQRNFRMDCISFFARGSFPRQTGNDGVYIANQSSSEAWIWYGHLKLPDNAVAPATVTYQKPGTDAVNTSPTLTDQNNPNNFYATQWVLGRKAILLVPESPIPTGSTGPAIGVWDNSSPPISQIYHKRAASPSPTSLGPLAQGTESYDSNGTFQIQQSRYDVAGVSMAQFSAILATVAPANPNTWWNGDNIDYRFQANPYLLKPIDSAGTARTTPVLFQGCTNFIVEYAGDFVHQDVTTGVADNWYGDPTAAPAIPKTDGLVDYILNTTTGQKTIRWYGFPRSTTGNKTINLANGDVVPLRDLVTTLGGAPVFERTLPSPTPKADYASNSSPIAVDAAYVCAWGPDDASEPRPSMIRITFTLDDPDGKLGNGITYEYVFKLQ